MKKLQLITGFSLVALLLVSCTSNRKVTTAPTPKPSVASAPAPPNPQTSDSSQQVARVPDLIESTDPATLPISSGRPDPFQTVTPPPIKLPVPPDKIQSNKTQPDKSQRKTQPDKTQPNTAQTSKTQSTKTQPNTAQTNKTQSTKTQPNTAQTSKTQSTKTQPNTAQTNTAQTSKTQPNTGQTSKAQTSKTQLDKIQTNNAPSNRTQPNITPTNKIQPNTPQINKTQPEKIQTEPSIELAKAVEVNGVMQVGGKLSAIVRTPDEKTSRYVSAGEYISNGAVLVKRIELGVNREPLVTLEQNGVEVIKQVGSTNGPVASLR